MGTTAVSIPEVEVLEELGRGAHSTVYRARRLGRYYAVKIPREESTLGEAAGVSARFVKEAIALARVRHPALPSVMEVGETGRFPYIIMELVAGETLAERLRRGPLDPSQTLQLGVQLSGALQKIHEAGLVHRDIKPSNILFDSLTTAVRLVDFGFVESASGESQQTSVLASENEAVPDDVQADLRALGSVLFQCATGAAPFIEIDPRPVLERDSSGVELLPAISRHVATILKRLLNLDHPGYRDARQLLKDLNQATTEPRERSSIEPTRSARPGLVARSRELERLRSALRASASGPSQVVVVRGKPGSGKTHLVREFLEQVSDTHRALTVQCELAKREPFGVVRKLLEQFLSEFDEKPPAERLRAFARFRSLGAGVAPLVRSLSSRLAQVLRDSGSPTTSGSQQVVSDEALADFVAQLLITTDHRVIVVDDTQWIDAGSRRVLGHLTALDVQRHLLVLTSRDDRVSWPALERLLRTLEVERVWELSLGAFDEDQTADLVSSYLAADSVDPELLRYVTSVSDGTPLAALEVLRSMLEGKALVPYWGEWKFDGTAASNLHLPLGSIELLKRRTEQFDPQRQGLLTLAAVLGAAFDEDSLASASGAASDELAAALAEARRAMLVETVGPGRHRFLHDSVREALLDRAGPEQLRRLHQRAAVALDFPNLIEKSPIAQSPLRQLGLGSLADDAFADPDFEAFQRLYELANHYAEGEIEQNPTRTLEICLKAGKLAFRAYDSDLALRFFDVASAAARATNTELDLESELSAAESQLRMGALEQGLNRLRLAIPRATDSTTRAYVHSRIAWAEMQIDTGRAWTALFDGYRALRRRPPSGTFVGVLGAIVAWLWYTIGPKPAPAPTSQRRYLEVLCRLNDQASRLAADTAHPARLLEAALRNLGYAEKLGPSSALNKAYLAYAFVLVALGLHGRARAYLLKAEQVAQTTLDPVVYAYSLQVHAAVAAWAGDIREALQVGARSLTEYAQWRELSEYCVTAYCQQQIEAVRGRNLDAWKWLQEALGRLSKHEGPPMALEFIEHSVRASLVALGRGAEVEPLLARLADVTTRPASRGTAIISSYGARVRVFTECGDLGKDFAAIVAEVKALGLNPKRVHMEVTEYYVHVAQARVHDCLRADPSKLQENIEELRLSLRDLKLAARIPLLKAHVAAIAANYHRFKGDLASAEHEFAAAEALGRNEGAPWVLYSVYRGRAHLLRAQGLSEAARDQAGLAETLAVEHGAAHRARWIREEFGLVPRRTAGSDTSPRSPALVRNSTTPGLEVEGPRSRPRARTYLKSLVRLGQHTAAELSLAAQAQAVLAELLEAVRADRGVLLITEDRIKQELEPTSEPIPLPTPRDFQLAGRLAPIGARSAAGNDLTDHSERDADPFWKDFEPLQSNEESMFPAPVLAVKGDRAVIGVSLSVRGEQFGAVFLDRPLRIGAFTDGDARALAALAVQVPLVFELARSLRARELAEETQRSTEKLEAIGRLAGGIAHDFNNMLSVILAVSDQILTGRTTRSLNDDVRTVQSAAERARDLTRQLLAFSRGQYLRPEVLQFNDLIHRLEPIFRRLLGETAILDLRLEPELCRVKADPAQMDQVLTNLVVNARDAMTSGGRLTVETANVTVTTRRSLQHPELQPGRYAQITVTDTGAGMDALTLAKAFEPFFSTKTGGNGLGLPTAYGIIKQSGGHIDVDSQPGVGTTFRIFLPGTEQRASYPAPPLQPSDRPGTETVLLVDDEPLVREATRRTLRSLGYQVIGAKSAGDALKIAADKVDAIDLVITDVMMPGMNGLELARELGKIRPALKVLFISGYTAGVLAERGFLNENLNFLQKPVARDALAGRIRELLDAE
jgi:signal transduction histidine kinase/serine/threonine protein kinase